MSLLDTINAAREEARAGGALPTRAEDKKEEEAKAARSNKKKSAASAKPAREAASSVRVAESAEKRANDLTLSKDERKAAKRERREEMDLRSQATQILLDHDEEYRRTEKVWWIILGIGFLSTIAALALYYLGPQSVNNDGTLGSAGIAGIVGIVIAYASIIGAFVYDWFKRRPIRRGTEAKVDGMSMKRIQAIFDQERKERAAKKAEKEARKAARNAGK